MAIKIVTTVNKLGQSAKLRLDDEIDREREFIEHLKKLVRREDLDSVDVADEEKPKRATS